MVHNRPSSPVSVAVPGWVSPQRLLFLQARLNCSSLNNGAAPHCCGSGENKHWVSPRLGLLQAPRGRWQDLGVSPACSGSPIFHGEIRPCASRPGGGQERGGCRAQSCFAPASPRAHTDQSTLAQPPSASIDIFAPWLWHQGLLRLARGRQLMEALGTQ